jgi:hypothetical protein
MEHLKVTIQLHNSATAWRATLTYARMREFEPRMTYPIFYDHVTPDTRVRVHTHIQSEVQRRAPVWNDISPLDLLQYT